MSYVISARLSNARQREQGSTEILFPLERNDYPGAIQALAELNAGDPVSQDCVVEEIDSYYGVLGCLKGQAINVDELDYLAKRLDSFDEYEATQFQAACHAFGCRDIRSLINMTFCSQETTVISDFSKLEDAGKAHYLTIHGGAAPVDEVNAVDGKALAENLIQSEEGTPTPYGLFFRNEMRMEDQYQGQGFPPYLWDARLVEVEIPKPDGTTQFAFLPTTELEMSRFCKRNGIVLSECSSVKLRWLDGDMDPVILSGDMTELMDYNKFSESLNRLTQDQRNTFFAAREATDAEDLFQMRLLLLDLDDFSFCPGVKNAEDYGRYMIQESGEFSYDPQLECYYKYEALGEFLMEHEFGQLTRGGYLKCNEESDFADFFTQRGPEQKRTQGEMTMEMEGMRL